MDQIEEFKKVALDLGYDPQEVDSFSKVIETSGQEAKTPSFSEAATSMGYPEQEVSTFQDMADTVGKETGQYADMGDYQYGGAVLGETPIITQKFGNRNKRYDNISGGVNRGADFAVPIGTPVFTPEGQWQVLDSYAGARGRGMQNSGWGNSVLLKNTQTGETIRLSHLSQVGVKPGDTIKGGIPVGLSGDTGHATGPHLDVEYTTPYGQLADILTSPYGSQFLQ